MRARQRDPNLNNVGRRQEIQQVEMDLRAKKHQKNAINDEIQCLELEIKNEELEQEKDENKQRLEALEQAQNALRSRFDNERTFSQGRKG